MNTEVNTIQNGETLSLAERKEKVYVVHDRLMYTNRLIDEPLVKEMVTNFGKLLGMQMSETNVSLLETYVYLNKDLINQFDPEVILHQNPDLG